jgi:predicted RNA binding protein YcfA (HicA-like mRNA interferase family)
MSGRLIKELAKALTQAGWTSRTTRNGAHLQWRCPCGESMVITYAREIGGKGNRNTKNQKAMLRAVRCECRPTV